MWKKLAAVVALASYLGSPAVFAQTPIVNGCAPHLSDGTDDGGALARLISNLKDANALVPKAPPPAVTLLDDHASLDALLVPVFEGRRLFNEPSAIDVSTSYSYNPAPLISAFSQKDAVVPVIDRTIASNARRTDPLFLGGHFFYGAGAHVKSITIDASCARWHQMSEKPGETIAKALLCSPVGGPIAMLCGQASDTLNLAKAGHGATHAIATAYKIFFGESNGEKAEDIGARAVDVFVLLAPGAKGSGIAAVDQALAKVRLEGIADGVGAKVSRRLEDEAGAIRLGADASAKAPSEALVRYDNEFADEQRRASSRAGAREVLGKEPMTPKGREITHHAADRMVNAEKNRLSMTAEEIDQVLDEGTLIKKASVDRKTGKMTITVKHPGMPGSPEVVVDEAGHRIVTVVKVKPK